MVNPLIFVCGIVFAISTYVVVFFRIHKFKALKMIDWFLLSLGTFNGLGFAFVFWASNRGMNARWNHYMNLYDNSTAATYLVSNFILGLSSFLGWVIFTSMSRTLKSKYGKVGFQNRAKMNIGHINKIKYLAWITLFIGIISYALYSKAYGGFFGLLKYSLAIRSGIMTVNNPFSFLQRFGGLAFFSSFLFFGLLIDKSTAKYHFKLCFLGFTFAFVFSLYVLYSWVGRVAMLTYFTTFILGYTLCNHRSPSNLIGRLFLLVVIFPFALLIVDRVLGRSSISLGAIELLAKELSFPFASYIVQLGQCNYRLFKDIFVAPLFILPQRIWSGMLNIELASSHNTYVFYGARKGEAGVSGSIPVDMITFAHMQASILGVVLVGLLWGGVLCYVERLCKRMHPIGVSNVVYANLVLNVAVLSVFYADPQHIIVRNFAVIIGIALSMLMTNSKLSLKKSIQSDEGS